MSKNLSEVEILHSIALYCEQYGATAENLRNHALIAAIETYQNADNSEIKTLLSSLDQQELTELKNTLEAYSKLPNISEDLSRKIAKDIDTYISDSWIKNTVFTFKKIVPIVVICAVIFFVSDKLFFPAKWRATYFPNKNLGGIPFGTYSERSPTNNWGFESPKSGMTPNNFSVRFESDFELDNDDSITFTVVGDDGIRLFVDEKLLLDFWIPQDSVPRIVNQNFSKGKHKVRLEYFEAEAGAKLSFTAINSNKKEVVFTLPKSS